MVIKICAFRANGPSGPGEARIFASMEAKPPGVQLHTNSVTICSTPNDGAARYRMCEDGSTTLDSLVRQRHLHDEMAPHVQWLSVLKERAPTRDDAYECDIVSHSDSWLIVDTPVSLVEAREIRRHFPDRVAVDRRLIPHHIFAELINAEFVFSPAALDASLKYDPVCSTEWVQKCCSDLDGTLAHHAKYYVENTKRFLAFRVHLNPANIISNRLRQSRVVLLARVSESKIPAHDVAVKIGPMSAIAQEESHFARVLTSHRPGGYWVESISTVTTKDWHAMYMELLGKTFYEAFDFEDMSQHVMSMTACEALAAAGIMHSDLWYGCGVLNMDVRTANMAFRRTEATDSMYFCMFDSGLTCGSIRELLGSTGFAKELPQKMYQWMNQNTKELIDIAKFAFRPSDQLFGMLDRLQHDTCFYEVPMLRTGICLQQLDFAAAVERYVGAFYHFTVDFWSLYGANVREHHNTMRLYCHEDMV